MDGDFVDEFGSIGSGNGQFDSPEGIAVTSNRIYVVDTENDRVQIFDLSGNFVAKFGTTGINNNQFNIPVGIAVTSNRIYITDSGNNRIQVFDLSGNFVHGFGTRGSDSGQFIFPEGIAVTSNRIYVADTFNERVQIFDLNGNFVSQFGTFAGGGNLSLTTPSGIYVTSTNLFVADTGGQRIRVFDLNGNFVRGFGSQGSGNGQFLSPEGVSVNSDRIFVADTRNNRVQIFDLNGGFVDSFGTPSNSGFSFPSDVFTSPDRIYVADTANHRVQIFDLNGDFVDGFGTEGSNDGLLDTPFGISVNSTHIFVADTNNERIQIFDLDGNFAAKFGSAGTGDGQFRSPQDVTVNATHIFVADGVTRSVQIFDLSGNFVDKFNTNHPTGSLRSISVNSNHIFIADYEIHLIHIFDLNGDFVGKFGSRGFDDGLFAHPQGIYVNSNRIYVADTTNHRVQIFDLDGNFVDSIGINRMFDRPGFPANPFRIVSGNNDGMFDELEGIHVNANRLYVADTKNHRIQIFEINCPDDLSVADGICVDPNAIRATLNILQNALPTITFNDVTVDVSINSTGTGFYDLSGLNATGTAIFFEDVPDDYTVEYLLDFSVDPPINTVFDLPSSDGSASPGTGIFNGTHLRVDLDPVDFRGISGPISFAAILNNADGTKSHEDGAAVTFDFKDVPICEFSIGAVNLSFGSFTPSQRTGDGTVVVQNFGNIDNPIKIGASSWFAPDNTQDPIMDPNVTHYDIRANILYNDKMSPFEPYTIDSLDNPTANIELHDLTTITAGNVATTYFQVEVVLNTSTPFQSRYAGPTSQEIILESECS